jgi:hypothetical protein
MSAPHSSDPRLAEALAECGRLREENRQLRERMGIPQIETAPPPTAVPGLPITVTGKSTPDEKVKLFRNLFRGREDIYALRWEGRNGKTGYSPDLVANYGHVIVDECHHISAVSFEQVLRQVKARYITGLTATPQRKDGHHPIIIMQCGPVRHRVNAKEQALARPFTHIVTPRPTNFRLPPSTEKSEMHELYTALADNKARNDLICIDMLRAIKAGRSPILLTERTGQVDEFAARLTGLVKHIVVLKGGMGAKQRRAIAEQLATIPDGEERVLLATGRYIGEGFDEARFAISGLSFFS